MPGQLIAPSLLVTVPVPEPPIPTTRLAANGMNVAVTVVAAETVTLHVVPLVLEHPDQPENVELAPGVAVTVTCVPLVTVLVQLDPQLMVPSGLVTVPEPVPARATVKVAFWPPTTSDRAGATRTRGLVTLPPARVSVMGRPVCWSALRSVLTDAIGAACLSTAKTPVTCGAAMEVPLA